LVLTGELVAAPQKATRRHTLDIDLDIIEKIYRGTNQQRRLIEACRINSKTFYREINKMEKGGYIVSVRADFSRGIGRHKGFVKVRYALTERAKMWRLVMQRAQELAPK
jgi:predicted transcriptional regulator